MIGDVALRWTVTILFGVSIATYAYLLVAQRVRWASSVDHLLHLAMSGAMILMVWRVGADLPAIGPALFFLLAGVWFVYGAVRASAQAGQRLKTCYYAAMMAAMAWMYVVMSGNIPGAHLHHASVSASAAAEMPDMAMPSHAMSTTARGWSWITATNWIAALGFIAVAVYWSRRVFGERRMTQGPRAARLARIEPLYQAFTAAGTALMFGAKVW